MGRWFFLPKRMLHWIGLRENLHETMFFTTKYRGFLYIFPYTNPMNDGSWLIQPHFLASFSARHHELGRLFNRILGKARPVGKSAGKAVPPMICAMINSISPGPKNACQWKPTPKNLVLNPIKISWMYPALVWKQRVMRSHSRLTSSGIVCVMDWLDRWMVDASMNFLSEKEVFFLSNLFQKYLVLAMRSMWCWEA